MSNHNSQGSATAPPAITGVVDSKGGPITNPGTTQDTALKLSGSSTTDTVVTVAGRAAANQSVQILDNDANRVTTPVNANGDWSSPLSGLSLGEHSLKAKGLYGSNPESAARVFDVFSTLYENFDGVTEQEIRPGTSLRLGAMTVTCVNSESFGVRINEGGGQAPYIMGSYISWGDGEVMKIMFHRPVRKISFGGVKYNIDSIANISSYNSAGGLIAVRDWSDDRVWLEVSSVEQKISYLLFRRSPGTLLRGGYYFDNFTLFNDE